MTSTIDQEMSDLGFAIGALAHRAQHEGRRFLAWRLERMSDRLLRFAGWR